jgi:COP9 signalosome complex subunit 3
MRKLVSYVELVLEKTPEKARETLWTEKVMLQRAGTEEMAVGSVGAGGFVTTPLLALVDELLGAGRLSAGSLLLAVQADVIKESSPASGHYVLLADTMLQLLCVEGTPIELFEMVAREVAMVARKLTKLHIGAGSSAACVRTLRAAAVRLAGSSQVLTPLHMCYMQACAAGGMYPQAFADAGAWDILSIKATEHGLTPQDYLQYFFYSGVVSVAMEDFPAALTHFKQCYLTPASNLSEIAREAFKKATLVELFLTGRALPIPNYVPVPVSRWADTTFASMPGYAQVSAAFEKKNAAALDAALKEYTAVFEGDTNLGLALRLPRAMVKHAIRKLTSTYITLSLSDIARQVGLVDEGEAEALVVEMVDGGEVMARIDRQSMMVHFGDDDQGDNASSEDAADVELLEERLKEAGVVANRLRDIQREIMTSKTYVRGSLSS